MKQWYSSNLSDQATISEVTNFVCDLDSQVRSFEEIFSTNLSDISFRKSMPQDPTS